MWIFDKKEICLFVILVVTIFCLILSIDLALTYGFVWLVDKVANTSLIDKFWWIYLLLLIAKMLFGKWVNTNDR